MTSTLRTLAPAKINWTLEVLRARPDGYHELRSVLQTIDACDVVTVSEARDIELETTGEPGPLADAPAEQNLAYRAAMALRKLARGSRGARIVLEKRVPVAAGLGGGSSDAAATLRALNELWDARRSSKDLAKLASTIGSDPPFFLFGGTAAVAGRGELVEPLVDALPQWVVLATPREHHRGEKTAEMFAALEPSHYTEGYATIGLVDTVQAQRGITDAELCNVFERVVARQQIETSRAMEALRAAGWSPHLCGAGPSFFLLVDSKEAATPPLSRIEDLGFDARVVRTLPRDGATRLEKM
jgi:4-diphosphocytidyl-2-C-methyl-D-erythritol kinase